MLPVLRSLCWNVTVSESVLVGLALNDCRAGISVAPGLGLIVVRSTTLRLGKGARAEVAVAVTTPGLAAITPPGAVTAIWTLRTPPGGTFATIAGLGSALQPGSDSSAIVKLSVMLPVLVSV